MTDYIITAKAVERWDLPHAILAGEAVRCRDCEYHVVDDIGEACTQFDCWFDPKRFENGFCAWGLRRAER